MKSDEVIEKIRHKLQHANPAQRTLLNTFQFNFTDVDGQLIKSVDLEIYEGTASHADGHITISDDDFYLVGTRQTTFNHIMQQEKAKLEGDIAAIHKMLEKFRLSKQN